MIPRWLHRFYAFVFGYFWTPCPVCGREFGGHEWRSSGHTIWTGMSGTATCPKCPVVSYPLLTGAGVDVLSRSKP